MRKSYNGLESIVRLGLGHDIMDGDLFLFVNRRRNRAKVLFFDGTGLCIFMNCLSSHYTSSGFRSGFIDVFVRAFIFSTLSARVFHRLHCFFGVFSSGGSYKKK